MDLPEREVPLPVSDMDVEIHYSFLDSLWRPS